MRKEFRHFCEAGSTLVAALLLGAAPRAHADSGRCPERQGWDESMQMCMPAAEKSALAPAATKLSVLSNLFFEGIAESGPRGRDAVSAPNWWMLDLSRRLGARNELALEWMGTLDLWTVPRAGTPELLQTGEADANGVAFVDAQHPHSTPVMGLTLSDAIALDAERARALTLFFAPRGEATAGPPAFMHRASSAPNPSVPLSHHLQDVFHVTSTVVGARLKLDRTTIEASAFSGVSPQPTLVNLDVHAPDSAGLRLTREALPGRLTLGLSGAAVTSSELQAGGGMAVAREVYYSGWVSSHHAFGDAVLDLTGVWGGKASQSDGWLNSLLVEGALTAGRNGAFARIELLQRTLEQLEVSGGEPQSARWVASFEAGYERELARLGGFHGYLGVSVTQDVLSTDIQSAYGGCPTAGAVFVRLSWGAAAGWGS